MQHSPQTSESTRTNSRGPLVAAALGGVLLVVLGINQWWSQPRIESQGLHSADVLEDDPSRGVTLAAEGEGVTLPKVVVVHHPQMTVLEAMRLAAQANERWQFAQQGDGASAFLTAIAETSNQGAEGRNWQYEVNGTRAELGIGMQELQPGDRVLWKFTPIRIIGG